MLDALAQIFIPTSGGGLLLIILVVVVILLIVTASQHRGHSARTDQRLCRACGASHPAFARFCRRCGQKLE